MCPKCKALVEVDTETRQIYIKERHKENADYPEVG